MSRINRRAALMAAAAVTTSSQLTTPASADDRAVKNGRIQQSIVSWCFTARGEKWKLDRLCEVAKQLKVPSVELVDVPAIATVKKHGLTCAIASNGMGFQRGFNNPRHRDELVTKMKSVIDTCAAAQIPSVICFVGMKWIKPEDPKSGEISLDDAFKHCVTGIKEVIGHAEKAGITMCIEHLNSRDGSDPMRGHPGYQGDDLGFVNRIINTIGSPRLKLLFDIYHVQIMHGDLIRRLEECKELIGHIHTAGNPGRGELDENQEINYPAVMKKLLQIGYKGYVGQEFIPTRNPLEGLQQAVTVCDV